MPIMSLFSTIYCIIRLSSVLCSERKLDYCLKISLTLFEYRKSALINLVVDVYMYNTSKLYGFAFCLSVASCIIPKGPTQSFYFYFPTYLDFSFSQCNAIRKIFHVAV